MTNHFSKYIVKPDEKIDLTSFDPSDKSGVPDSKTERNALVEKLSPQLGELQEHLFAEGKRKFLIVLQGMDTSGKDGTIRRVFQAVNPLGIRVAYFGVPTEKELARDYLWRVHMVVPRRGEMVIFNRSHYEDILTVPVHGWITEEEEALRIRQINQFEQMLTETGTTIVKLFLHISKDEQKERLQERLDREDKHWKFSLGDLEDRKLWDKFYAQYEKVLEKTSTDYAPWYIIPSNSKSTRDCIITHILIDKLRDMNIEFPKVDTTDWPKKIK